MTSDGLPKAPARWADALSALTPDLALALGPVIRGLDELVAAGDPPVAARNFADGFDGLSRRGHPHLMLASEWLLATELPLEFSRRAAHGELLHLAPAASSPQGTGRVAVLVDTGPDQAGAGRLVQLAALIVLHRRAAGRGTDLSVGILGDEPGKWLNGDLPEVLRRWLKARRAEEPAPADVESWARVVDHADEMWILTGPRLASRLPGRGRLLCSSESSWSADGADRVRVSLNGGGSDLVLPSGPVAVRALRGEALVRAVPAKAEPLPAPRLRFPGFPSSARQVLARGATSSELITLRVPYRTGQAVG